MVYPLHGHWSPLAEHDSSITMTAPELRGIGKFCEFIEDFRIDVRGLGRRSWAFIHCVRTKYKSSLCWRRRPPTASGLSGRTGHHQRRDILSPFSPLARIIVWAMVAHTVAYMIYVTAFFFSGTPVFFSLRLRLA